MMTLRRCSWIALSALALGACGPGGPNPVDAGGAGSSVSSGTGGGRGATPDSGRESMPDSGDPGEMQVLSAYNSYPWLTDGGVPISTCGGEVEVDAGWLGAGTGSATAAATVTPDGIRLLLASNPTDGCLMQLQMVVFGPGATPPRANLELTLAPNLGPGSYVLDGSTTQVTVTGTWWTPEAVGGLNLQSGILELTSASASAGLAGSYRFTFSNAPSPTTTSSATGTGTGTGTTGGAVSTAASFVTAATTGSTGTTGTAGATGTSGGGEGEPFPMQIVEAGTFTAPFCNLCGGPASPCGDSDGGCEPGWVCLEQCTSNELVCVPPLPCTGAASCENCTAPLSGGAQCESFDGLTMVCVQPVVFH